VFSFKIHYLLSLIILNMLSFTANAAGGGAGAGSGSGSGSSVPFLHPFINLLIFLAISLYFFWRKK